MEHGGALPFPEGLRSPSDAEVDAADRDPAKRVKLSHGEWQRRLTAGTCRCPIGPRAFKGCCGKANSHFR